MLRSCLGWTWPSWSTTNFHLVLNLFWSALPIFLWSNQFILDKSNPIVTFFFFSKYCFSKKCHIVEVVKIILRGFIYDLVCGWDVHLSQGRILPVMFCHNEWIILILISKMLFVYSSTSVGCLLLKAPKLFLLEGWNSFSGKLLFYVNICCTGLSLND